MSKNAEKKMVYNLTVLKEWDGSYEFSVKTYATKESAEKVATEIILSRAEKAKEFGEEITSLSLGEKYCFGKITYRIDDYEEHAITVDIHESEIID